MRVQIVNKVSGEMLDLPASTPEDILYAWRMAQEYEKVAARIKDTLKKSLVPQLLDEQGRSPVYDKYQFKRIDRQTMTYDMTALRNAFDNDEDLISHFLKVNRKAVDEYVKDHKEELTEDTIYALKSGLIADGPVITSIRLERIMS